MHVERDDRVAKFWRDPVRLERSNGFARAELGRIQRLVASRRAALLEAWNDYFHD